SSGRSARLHKALVERKLATEASSEFWPTIDPSVFALDVTVWEGVSIDRAERVLMEEIEKIQNTPPSKHELERAIAQIKAQYAYQLHGCVRHGFLCGIV